MTTTSLTTQACARWVPSKLARTENVQDADEGQVVRTLPEGSVDYRHDPQEQGLRGFTWHTRGRNESTRQVVDEPCTTNTATT